MNLKVSMKRESLLWKIETTDGRQTYVGQILLDGVTAHTVTSGRMGWFLIEGAEFEVVEGRPGEPNSVATIRPVIHPVR